MRRPWQARPCRYAPMDRPCALEVARAGGDAHFVRAEHAHMAADAGAAGRRCHDRAGLHQRRDIAGGQRGAMDRLGAGRDDEARAGRDLAALHHARGHREIVERAVAAGADERLVDVTAGDLADADRVVHHRVGQCDQRLDRGEVDRAAFLVHRIRVRHGRRERLWIARLHVVDQRVVGLEDDELGGKFGAHRGQRAARVQAHAGDAGSAVFDVLVDVRAPLAGDGEEYVLGRHAGAECAGEVVADRLADAEPGLAGGDRVQHVRAADAARRAIERTGAAGVRVGIHQHSAGQRVSLVGDDRVADALIGADIVQALDAELTRECAAGLHARGCLGRRCWDEMVEDNHHLGRIGDLQHLAPAFRQEGKIDQARGLDIDDGRRRLAIPLPSRWLAPGSFR